MRITQDYLLKFNLRNFYDSFRELYGDIFSNSDINSLLETNEFYITCYIPDLQIYQEVGLPSQDIAEYFISIRLDNTLSPRFRITWARVPLTTGKTVDRIGEINVLNKLDRKLIFCETHSFLIMTSIGNAIDMEFFVDDFDAKNTNERAIVLKNHLEKIITENDPRRKYAEYILNRFPDLD